MREILAEHKARTGGSDDEFVFGSVRGNPFTPSNADKRAKKAWREANAKREECRLRPLTFYGLQDSRHVFVSLMYDAGFSLERIGDYVGHSGAYMTARYKHLVRDHLEDAAARMDAYLMRRIASDGHASGTQVPEIVS